MLKGVINIQFLSFKVLVNNYFSLYTQISLWLCVRFSSYLCIIWIYSLKNVQEHGLVKYEMYVVSLGDIR